MKKFIQNLLREGLNKDKLINDINNFTKLNLNSGVKISDLINSCDLSKGQCDTVSNMLYKHLLEIGYDDNQLILIDLLNPKFETDDAHPEWKKYDKKYLVHTILKVGDLFIDLTGAQYSKQQMGVKLYTKEDLKNIWGNYKLMKKDDTGKYIGGTEYTAKLRKF
tara:strand:+ start:3892 stop:4383 length:492 start_codon:yes stop_codon:yes gene_type:complete